MSSNVNICFVYLDVFRARLLPLDVYLEMKLARLLHSSCYYCQLGLSD
jgi:hypothetical protein